MSIATMFHSAAAFFVIPDCVDAAAIPEGDDASLVEVITDFLLAGKGNSIEVPSSYSSLAELGIVAISFVLLLRLWSKPSSKGKKSKSSSDSAPHRAPAAQREGDTRQPQTLQDFKALIQQASERRDWRSALQLLRRVQDAGLRLDVGIYVAAISACSKAGETRKTLALVQKMRREGLQPDEICLNLEATALAESQKNGADVEETQPNHARGAQRSPQQRVHYLTKAGYLKEGVELLYELWRQGAQPNLIDCHSAIDACSKMGNGTQALSILEDMRAHGVEPDPPCFSAAIGALGKCGMWQRAVELLTEMQQQGQRPTVACYSAAIIACAKGKQRVLALEILNQVKATGLRPDIISFNAAINACAKTGAWEHAIELVGEMQSEGVSPTLVSYSSAIHACAKSGSVQAAYVAQELMRRVEIEGLTPDVLMYNQCMDACQKCGQWQWALGLLRDMTAKSLEPSPITHIAAINAYAAGDMVEEAVSHLEQMREKGFEVDGSVCDTVNRILAKAGQWERALQIQGYRSRLKIEARRDHQNSHLPALNACAKNGRWENALQLLREMQSNSRKPNQASVNALIVACLNARIDNAWSKALEYLYEYEEGVGISGYNAALHACARSGKWESAVELLRNMQWKSVEVNKITYNTVMNACAKALKWELALNLMKEMTTHNLHPDGFTYNTAIDATARGGQWEMALTLYNKMESEGLSSTVIGPTVVIHSCCKAGQWKEALNVLTQSHKKGLQIERSVECVIARAMLKRVEEAPEEKDAILAAMKAHGLKS